MEIQFLELQNIATKLGLTGYRTNPPSVSRSNRSRSPLNPEKVILNVKEITKLDDKMIKSNEKEFIRNWHQHKVALTRENTRIKQPIRDEEITYDQSDISHLASGLPSGIDNLVRNGSHCITHANESFGPFWTDWGLHNPHLSKTDQFRVGVICVGGHVIIKKIDKRKRG